MPLLDHFPVQSDWASKLSAHLDSDGFRQLSNFVDQQRASHVVFPAPDNVFRALECTSFTDTKVVILGQDPYHGPGQAHGLSFSVQHDVRLPPSLKNIFHELTTDIPQPSIEQSAIASGNLESWARQGVLMLNAVMTVRQGEANSHKGRGWEAFTDAVITSLNDHPQTVVFLLWGNYAQKKTRLIDDRHVILTSAHPSPLSAYRGFFDSRPFTRINGALAENGRGPVDWLRTPVG